MRKQLVYVGSTSMHKIGAVHEAFVELGIEAEVAGMKVASGVNEQPVKSPENDEILEGATNRAECAFERGCDLAIGIENGIEFRKSTRHAIAVDIAYVVVINGDGGIHFATSTGMPVNYGDVENAQSRGFDKHTVASVTAERTGCDPNDATPHYTGGRMTRAELLKQAVKLALCQWLAAKDGVAP